MTVYRRVTQTDKQNEKGQFLGGLWVEDSGERVLLCADVITATGTDPITVSIRTSHHRQFSRIHEVERTTNTRTHTRRIHT